MIQSFVVLPRLLPLPSQQSPGGQQWRIHCVPFISRTWLRASRYVFCDVVVVVLLLLFQKYSTMDYIFINKYWLYSWMKFTVVFLHTRINPLIKSYLVLLSAPSSVGNHCTQSGKSSFRFHFLEDITVWLISFSIMPFGFILLAANKGISFLFLGE